MAIRVQRVEERCEIICNVVDVVVRLGGKRAVPTPANFAIYAALRPYADGPPAGAAPP